MRRKAAAGDRALHAGIYRDPWFGDVAVCSQDGAMRVRAVKSPKLVGTVMRAGDRLVVDWDDADVDAEAVLVFKPQQGSATALTMSKLDPEADFSYDYEDLSFVRVGDCTH